MTDMHIDSCPLCSGGGQEPLFQAERVPVRHIRPAGSADRASDYGDLNIVICSDCGHLYNAAFDDAGSDDLYQVHPATNAPVHASMLAGLRDAAGFILGDGGRRSRILEIGCGSGALAVILAEHADQVHLIEPNLSLSGEAFGDRPIEVLPGFFPAASTGQLYDLIVCRQVLEHVSAPIPFLEAIRAHLAPGGEAYLEVPDADYIATCASPTDFHYLHVQYYSRRNMESLLRRLGFSIKRFDSIKNGHDMGFVVEAASPSNEALQGPAFAPADLQGVMRRHLNTAQSRLEAIAGRTVIFGACAYAQGLLGLYPDIAPPLVFDDTAAYEGHEAFWYGGRAPVMRPTAELLADVGHIVICAYLHDKPIAENLGRLGYAGDLHSLRTDDLRGVDGRPPSLFR